MAKTSFLWDDENVEHIAAHGLTPEDVEPVVVNIANRMERSNSSRRTMTFGLAKTTPARYIAVAWEERQPDHRVVRVITAYDVARPERRR